jgi:hypothetical protein
MEHSRTKRHHNQPHQFFPMRVISNEQNKEEQEQGKRSEEKVSEL